MKAVVFVLGDRKIKANYWDHTLGIPEAPLMEARHIVELHQAGFEIGAHSMSHVRLTDVQEDNAWEEISRSRMMLEILLNGEVHSFSYPYGSLSAGTKRMVQSAGYRAACSVSSGPASFGKDLFELRRLTVFNKTGVGGLALRMLAPYEYYTWLRWSVKKLIQGNRRVERKFQRLLDTKKKKQNRDLHHLLKLEQDAYDK